MNDLLILAIVAPVLAVELARRYRLGARWSVFRRRVSKVSEGRIGLVRLEGRAMAADQPLVRAPISGIECLFYDCVVEDASGDSTRTVRREYRGVCFHIDDGTGVALVRFEDAGQSPAVPVEFDGPVGVSCAIPLDREAEPGSELRAALERTAVIRPGDDLPRRLSAREGSIAPGDHVSVVGTASLELDPREYGHRGPPRAYVISHAPGRPLVIVRGQLDLRSRR